MVDLSAEAVTGPWVMRMPVVNWCWSICWQNSFICLTPMADSVVNSTQMVPISGVGEGFDGVGRGVYFVSINAVGRAEKFIFLRLG